MSIREQIEEEILELECQIESLKEDLDSLDDE